MQLYAMAVPATAIAPLKVIDVSAARIAALKDADASTQLAAADGPSYFVSSAKAPFQSSGGGFF
jgi:hypothetical protein